MDSWLIDLSSAILTMALCVGIHYEVLSYSTWLIRRLGAKLRMRVAFAVLCALTAHLLEITLFTVGWTVLILSGYGSVSIESPTIIDLAYFSMATYTSLGYGDIVPIGGCRLFAGVEALTGLVLIAWTASFTYLEMQRYWECPGRFG